ncbi:hypothetical protein V6N11_082179 [Hibiscus sabdariffa]|uniref:Uncharacterized protein n=1 Tax=Hibiscus sabdariffa TaxID=183260 RepID=A0ABR2QHG2_9ROSI
MNIMWREDISVLCARLTNDYIAGFIDNVPRLSPPPVAALGNGVADGLARLAYGAPVGAWIFREPPAEVATALLKDLHDLA